MRRARGIVCWLAMLALAACDPAWYIAIRQPVGRDVPASCLEAALRADARIDTVARDDRGEIVFALRDSTLRGGWRRGTLTVRRPRRWSSDTLAALQLAIVWRFPAAGIRADSQQTRALTTTGRSVTESVRRACAPAVPSASSCRVIGTPFARKGRCVSEA